MSRHQAWQVLSRLRQGPSRSIAPLFRDSPPQRQRPLPPQSDVGWNDEAALHNDLEPRRRYQTRSQLIWDYEGAICPFPDPRELDAEGVGRLAGAAAREGWDDHDWWEKLGA